MKALLFDTYGALDTLEVREVPTPTPGDRKVLVRVHAVAVNDWDWGLLNGTPFFPNRLLGGLLRPRVIVGSDIAGRVERVGARVTRFRPGDEVFGDLSPRFGGCAEYVCARETALTLKPAGMTFAQAAAIPQAGMLAVQGLLDVGRLQPGQKLLINGAGGGVGTFAIQLARLPRFSGVEITGVDSAGKLEMLRAIGCDHVIDYRQEDFTSNGHRYDLILDARTTRSPHDYARALNPDGTYATVGGEGRRLMQVMVLGPWIRRTAGKNIRMVGLKANKDLPFLNQLFDAGQFVPVIDGPYRFAEARDAFRHFGTAEHKGKIVITLE